MAIVIGVCVSTVGCSESTDGTSTITISSIVSTALKIAYATGGAENVATKINEAVEEGKITEEQAEILRTAIATSYDALLAKLDEMSETTEAVDTVVEDNTATATQEETTE